MGLEITTHRAHAPLEVGLNHREHHGSILEQFEAVLKLAERWSIPNLICFSGNRDGLGERLFALAPEPKRFVRLPGADHVSVLEGGGLAPGANGAAPAACTARTSGL